MSIITTTCDVKDHLALEALTPLQGTLKTITAANIVRRYRQWCTDNDTVSDILLNGKKV
jgi:hypothetical protein